MAFVIQSSNVLYSAGVKGQSLDVRGRTESKHSVLAMTLSRSSLSPLIRRQRDGDGGPIALENSDCQEAEELCSTTIMGIMLMLVLLLTAAASYRVTRALHILSVTSNISHCNSIIAPCIDPRRLCQ